MRLLHFNIWHRRKISKTRKYCFFFSRLIYGFSFLSIFASLEEMSKKRMKPHFFTVNLFTFEMNIIFRFYKCEGVRIWNSKCANNNLTIHIYLFSFNFIVEVVRGESWDAGTAVVLELLNPLRQQRVKHFSASSEQHQPQPICFR